MYCVDFIFRNEEYIHFLNIESTLSKDAPILILLHGFPDNAFGWDLQIESLKGKFHIIAPFMPGTLNDEKVQTERIAGTELKNDLKEIIKKVRKTKNQKIYFISHDLGSFLSVAMTQEMLNDVHGLIHINGLGLAQFVDRKWSFSQWCKSYYVILAQSSITRFFVNVLMPKYFLNKIYNLSGISSSDEMRTSNDKRVFNSIAIYKHLFRGALKVVGTSVPKIKAPVLFVWGNEDAFLNIPTLDEVERFYTNGNVRILKGGHWVMRSQSEQVNRILIKTLLKWEQSA